MSVRRCSERLTRDKKKGIRKFRFIIDKNLRCEILHVVKRCNLVEFHFVSEKFRASCLRNYSVERICHLNSFQSVKVTHFEQKLII